MLWGTVLLMLCAVLVGGLPCPFTRELSLQTPLLSGSDVYVLQNLLLRTVVTLPLTSQYDEHTEQAVTIFQKKNNLNPTGIVDENTAVEILNVALDDNYKDDGKIPLGYKYKVFVPVYRNRSIETAATLYAANGSVLHTFQVRAKGQNNVDGTPMNQLCDDGSTPTGLMTFDLNSPEDDPVDYGPYPINRAVQGVLGNAAIVISNIRDGILLHTGEWPDWHPAMPMPDSHGCIHAHPTDVQFIWTILVSIGVEVHNNTSGKLPYPYVPQGVLSVQQLD